MNLKNQVWKTLSRKVVFRSFHLMLYEDMVTRPDGRVVPYYIVRRAPFSIVVPIDGQKIYLVRQYRHAVSSLTLEFPMGFVEDKKPLEMAVIELKQETGIRAKSIKQIGKFTVASGHTDQIAHVFVAEDLTFGAPRPEEGEFIKTEEYLLKEVGEMISKGEILDGPTIVAYHFLEAYLGGI